MGGVSIPLMLISILILGIAFGINSSSEPELGVQNLPLPSALPTKHETAIVAAPDGTVYLVEIGSGKILWSFSSGPSIYSSYQQIPYHEGEELNTSINGDNFYIDCGDDWELYMHGNGLKKVKLPLSAEDFVQRTPFVLGGGGVMLGSKSTTLFLIDAKTGRIVRTIRSDNLPPVLSRTDIEEWNLLDDFVDEEDPVETPLYVTRTDYALKYTSVKTGKILWYLMFADIEASFHCEGIENVFGGFPIDKQFRGQGLDTPMHCQKRPIVYRVRDRSSLEHLFRANGLRDVLGGGGGGEGEGVAVVLSDDRSHDQDIMFALPKSGYEVLPQSWSRMIYWGLGLIGMIFLFGFRSAFFRRKGLVNRVNEDINLHDGGQAPKKRKGRRKNKKGVIFVEKQEDISETTEGLLTLSSPDTDDIILGEMEVVGEKQEDCSQIGKLILSDKVIGKGSDGTIVLEGNYEGREVAVKRLVRAHCDNAGMKEIQNLIKSDRHQNIVRWHGVEYDQHFVYICLERCTCNLDDLISFCTSQNQVTLLSPLGSDMELKLLKASGYPSAMLIKLMRDIVRGLAHLHELKIIHRDLKPQNVLILKDRTLSAKISDMGISKQLGEMPSLPSTTGSGTSGWQAPEQLRKEPQTRAVDIYNLGCVLFFCMTGGKHPFGKKSREQERNILKDRKNLSLIKAIPEATDLISRLLDANLKLRPTAMDVLRHPLFWDCDKRLSFLRDASDRVDKEDASDLLVQALEARGGVVFGSRWDKWMEKAVIHELTLHRRYKYDSLRDLLRVARNTLNHHRDLPQPIQAILGSVPEEFDSYFWTRFPKLLIEVYLVFLGHCAGETWFCKYFTASIS